MTSFKGLFDCLYDPIPKDKEGWLSQRRKGMVLRQEKVPVKLRFLY